MSLNLDKFTLIRVFILLVCVVLVIIGTALAQLKNGDIKLYLREIRTGDVVTDYGDIGCTETKDQFNTAYAFAIMSCIFIGFAFLTVILIILGALSNIGRTLKIASVIFSVISFFFVLISWAIVVGVYHGKNCDAPQSLKDGGFDIAPGLALLISTWCILTIDLVAAILSLVAGGSEDLPNANKQ
eukprot:GDKJ01032533.1.p1 GENE.GDKJ01032533.1~~GDKJ01032533.1.p1  ORF type:complete len:185 (-),score=27.53 GDKJ01032533.1:258-812(-)